MPQGSVPATSVAVVAAARNAAPVPSSSAAFSKLRKDLAFHAARLQRLLATRVAGELGPNLRDAVLTREECGMDCAEAIARFEEAAADASGGSRWDERRVSTLFGLEVPLESVVGSSRFAAPVKADCHAISQMIRRLEAIARRFPEFASGEDESEHQRRIDALLAAIEQVEWNGRDVQRIREAIAAKLAVLSDLAGVADTLQAGAFDLSREEAALEALRRAETAAADDGEVAVSDAVLRQKLQSIERQIDLLVAQSVAVAESAEETATKRKNNTAVFQSASAMLSVLITEKQAAAKECDADVARIDRGLAYEERATGAARAATVDAVRTSKDRLRALGERQTALTVRLREAFAAFEAAETELAAVGEERAEAIAAHMALVDGSRESLAGMADLAGCSLAHRRNLERTRAEHDRGMEALATLEALLLQGQGFDRYDFKAAARRLGLMQRRVCVELSRCASDYERTAGDFLRRLAARQRGVEDDCDVARCALELRREVFDPETKRAAARVREVEALRDSIAADAAAWGDAIAAQKARCSETAAAHLSAEELARCDEAAVTAATAGSLASLQRREDVAEMRAALLAPPEAAIGEERRRLQLERQATDGHASYGGRTSTANSASNATSTTGEPNAGSSRVLTVRDEVRRSKRLLAQLEEEQREAAQARTLPLGGGAASTAARSEHSAMSTGSKAADGGVRPPRVIRAIAASSSERLLD